MAKKKTARKRAPRKTGRPRAGQEWKTDEIIALAATMLARGFFKHQIKLAIAGVHKDRRAPSARTYEEIFKLGRELLRKQGGLNRQETRDAALAVYRGIVSSKTAKPMEKIKAQERIDKIMGHEHGEFEPTPGPLQLHISGPDGEPIQVESDLGYDPKEKLRRLVERHRSAEKEAEGSESEK